MKTIITSFETPEVQVQLSNIKLDLTKKTFSLILGTKGSKQRKFHEQQVSGTITSELHKYFSLFGPIKVPTKNEEGEIVWVPTGRTATGFQKFCVKHNIPYSLEGLSFVSDNTSKEFKENPFRLVMLKNRNILTLVNVPSKSKTDYLKGDGSIGTSYKVKRGVIQGKSVKAFVRPEKYRRLVQQVEKTIEIAEVEGYVPVQ